MLDRCSDGAGRRCASTTRSAPGECATDPGGLGPVLLRVDLEDGLASFVALFRGPDVRDERQFEELLWEQLREVHAADEQPWTPDVSGDPDDPHFAFSAAGTAYFVVGLHPMASREARRAPVPTLVFNLHAQFEQLRASGTFSRMRDRIRARDRALQGQINPMVSDYGTSSEARQYSGREVGPDWRAPFEPDPQALVGQYRHASRTPARCPGESPRSADRDGVPAPGRRSPHRRGPHRGAGERLLRLLGR